MSFVMNEIDFLMQRMSVMNVILIYYARHLLK